MHNSLHTDLSKIDQLLNTTLQQGLAYLHALDDTPTTINLQEPDYHPLQQDAQGAAHALQEFEDRFRASMVACSGPRYWGFVTGGTTPAALVGDWLAAIYDQNTQSSNGQGDVSARVEQETIKLLLSLFELPDDFTGGFVTGATMSNFTCLAVARQWVGQQLGRDIAREGIDQPITTLAAVPHSSSIKALSMLGMGSANLRQIPTIDASREAMDPSKLEAAISGLKGEPFILISSGGTVNTVDFDDMAAIAQLKQKHNFWWHIDAAFGGFAALTTEYKHLLKGWELADSITIDGHKWLNVPYESAFFFTRKEHSTLQVETFQNSNAPYLGDPLANLSYLNFLPENSRRFKALPAWFSLKAYGRDGHREIVERSIHLAQALGTFIQHTSGFELLAPTRLNTVCFTLSEAMHAHTSRFLHLLNERGRVFMTPTVFNGKIGIRAALVNWRTTDKDLEVVKEELIEVYKLLPTQS